MFGGGGGGGGWGGVFFFGQKTAYEIYQCDWSSDVCSSDLSKADRREPSQQRGNTTGKAGQLAPHSTKEKPGQPWSGGKPRGQVLGSLSGGWLPSVRFTPPERLPSTCPLTSKQVYPNAFITRWCCSASFAGTRSPYSLRYSPIAVISWRQLSWSTASSDSSV